FLIMDGQGQEIDSRLGVLGRDHGGEHGRVAIFCEDRTIGLTGYLSRFEDERTPAPFNFFTMNFKHASCLMRSDRRGEPWARFRDVSRAKRPAILPMAVPSLPSVLPADRRRACGRRCR